MGSSCWTDKYEVPAAIIHEHTLSEWDRRPSPAALDFLARFGRLEIRFNGADGAVIHTLPQTGFDPPLLDVAHP